MESYRPPQDELLEQIEFRAMGSGIFAAVQSSDPAARAMLAEVPAWFAEWEQVLSRFRDTSELSTLNSSAGESPVRVSSTLWSVLEVALIAAEQTGGLVTPTLLNALEAAGYTRTFDAMKAETHDKSETSLSTEQPQAAATQYSWRDIELFRDTQRVRLPRGLRLDFGGIAKGWAADEAARRLAKFGPAIVNAGGDIAVSDTTGNRVSWPIGVDAPVAGPHAVEPAEQLALLAIESGGVATSGRDYRRWQQDGRWQHHIIDPRTGRPSTSDVMLATVIAPAAWVAEISAKAAMLLGSRDGMAWIEARPGLAGILVLENEEVLYSTRMENYAWK